MKNKIPKGAIDTSKMTINQIADLLMKQPQMIKDMREISGSNRKIRLLFVCAGGLDRSPTAVNLFKNSKIYEAKSCGIHPLISAPVTKQALQWADYIFVMEPEHKRFILENFPQIIKTNQKLLFLIFLTNTQEIILN